MQLVAMLFPERISRILIESKKLFLLNFKTDKYLPSTASSDILGLLNHTEDYFRTISDIEAGWNYSASYCAASTSQCPLQSPFTAMPVFSEESVSHAKREEVLKLIIRGVFFSLKKHSQSSIKFEDPTSTDPQNYDSGITPNLAEVYTNIHRSFSHPSASFMDIAESIVAIMEHFILRDESTDSGDLVKRIQLEGQGLPADASINERSGTSTTRKPELRWKQPPPFYSLAQR